MECSCDNNMYDVIEFENVKDYEAYKVTKYDRIRKTGEDMIKINILGIIFFSNTNDCSCDDGVKMLVITVRDPSYTLSLTTYPVITPNIPII